MLLRIYVRKRKDEEKIEEEEEQRIEEDFAEAEWRGSSCYEVVTSRLKESLNCTWALSI